MQLPSRSNSLSADHGDVPAVIPACCVHGGWVCALDMQLHRGTCVPLHGGKMQSHDRTRLRPKISIFTPVFLQRAFLILRAVNAQAGSQYLYAGLYIKGKKQMLISILLSVCCTGFKRKQLFFSGERLILNSGAWKRLQIPHLPF